MAIEIPFTKRTTTAVTVFACIFIASPQGAQALNPTFLQLGALALEYSNLINVYRLLLRQDAANSQTVLYANIAQATTAVAALNVTLDSMTATGDAKFVLAGMQEAAAQALTTLRNVATNE